MTSPVDWLMPLTLWPVRLVPAWFRRLHQRHMHWEMAAVSLACVVLCAFGVGSSVWPEHSIRLLLPTDVTPTENALRPLLSAG